MCALPAVSLSSSLFSFLPLLNQEDFSTSTGSLQFISENHKERTFVTLRETHLLVRVHSSWH